jgi:hypothetical protein
VQRVHGVGLTGARRAAALVDAAGRAIRAKYDGAAGQGFVILGVPDQQARDVGEGVMEEGRSRGHRSSAEERSGEGRSRERR